MKKEVFIAEQSERLAVLVACVTQKQTTDKTKEYLTELAFLAETLEIKTVYAFMQRMERSNPQTFVNAGKLAEIKAYIVANHIQIIIFDDELTPSQVRNLEKEFKDCSIVDRSLLILEVFKQRAKTAQAKTQVELAQYQYMLPRLTRLWTHLERQQGGIGVRSGAGEKEIETDKRIIKNKIALLKEKLGKIEQQNATQRKSRDGMVRVALVGYTNVGKSTLMRLLSKSDVFAENKLFATVDSTVRRVDYDNISFLLTDTVGFIRKLPTTLIESFKSTLVEIVEADILLHIVDLSHQGYAEQMEVVQKTLEEIKALNKQVILVFNKIDLYRKKQAEIDPLDLEMVDKFQNIEDLEQMYFSKSENVVFISAENKENLDKLKTLLVEEVKKRYYEIYPNYLNP